MIILKRRPNRNLKFSRGFQEVVKLPKTRGLSLSEHTIGAPTDD